MVYPSLPIAAVTLLIATFHTSQASEQTCATTSAVPAGIPISGDYTGHFRPQVHFSPPVGFMNDPNGLFLDASGTYHLYYQYNPTDIVAGNQHWGHATSPDLYHWTNQPIVLFPHLNVTGIFTGSVVIDVNNTSGFFPNQTNGVVAIYTGNGPDDENQRLAYSFDDGLTFQHFDGNPVLAIGSTQFRDPKVIWHTPSQLWVMSVAYAQALAIGFFTSPNLRTWTHASNFSFHVIGDQYECPNLLPIPMIEEDGTVSEGMYLLYISINPGAPLGGSIGQYFPGHFNGTHFTPVDEVLRLADFGKDNYATQFWYGIDAPPEGGALSIAWGSSWQYANDVPTGPREGWRHIMTVPRRNFLKNVASSGWTLVSRPFDLTPVLGMVLANSENLGSSALSAFAGGSADSGIFLITVNITNLDPSSLKESPSLSFTVSSSSTGENLKGIQTFGNEASFSMDRSNTTGFTNSLFTPQVNTTLSLTSTWHMTAIVDRSIWEVFLQDGEKSGTQTFFTQGMLDTVVVEAVGLIGAKVSVQVSQLKSTWV